MRRLLLATIATIAPAAAWGQSSHGLYVGAGAGVTVSTEALNDERPRLNGLASLSLGWAFGSIRAELQGTRFETQSPVGGGFELSGRPSLATRGQSIMGNVIFDLPLLSTETIIPYAGVGLGYVWSENDLIESDASAVRLFSSDLDPRFAYQGILGVAVPLSFVPGLAITGDYRYLGAADRRPGSGGGRSGERPGVEGDAGHHSVTLGLRYAFGGSAPTAAASPPLHQASTPHPPTTRTFLVFFDFSQTELTPRARQILSDAAAFARRAEAVTVRIEVAGHADRSGTPQYNERISRSRGEIVASELQRHGIARGEIFVQMHGEIRPLVASQTISPARRLEIVLR